MKPFGCKYMRSHSVAQILFLNAELLTHGFNSADLGMGPYRNTIIINTILKKPYFKFQSKTPFQQFKVVY
jgi:lysine N6-hydroxylase